MSPAVIEKKLKAARDLLSDENFAAALPRFEELTRLRPDSAAIWLGYGAAAASLGQTATAELAWRKARDLAADNATLLLQLGHQYRGARQLANARACYEQAAEADPREINAHISLAVLFEKNHQLEESRACVNKCLVINPSDEQARYFCALLDRRENKIADAERGLRDLIASEPKHPYVCYACRYELAQILDQTDRFDEAMRALADAKALVRNLADIEEVSEAFDAMIERGRHIKDQPKDSLRTWAKSFPKKERKPIPTLAFLGGHPRSGTTLMEQILGAHPQILALDEPHLFQSVLIPEVQKVRPLSASRLNVVRRLYTRALEQECGSEASGKLLLEKNPSLTSALPMWLRVFPDLRVIIALRDPRDVVISCYFQNLPLNVANANFLSLERIAKHYAALMDVWLAVREWEGLLWIETRYEDTIADLEKEGRRVTEFLGLPWDDAQRRFYEKSRKQRLYSPTYRDVTRPVYTRSVARWRAYEKHLAPILPMLEPYCRAFGYA
ncbi:MAG: tetratricopeptide repeat-containing sulfotransferase family protein [Limisphaerales bacterium]